MIRFVAIVILSCLLISCEKWKVDKSTSDINDIFSVNCLLNPNDSLVQVRVYKVKDIASEPRLDTELSIENATVIFLSENQSFNLAYNESTKSYISSTNEISLKALGKYKIEVRVLDQVLTAETQIPLSAKVDQNPFEILINERNSVRFKVKWSDPTIGQFNYLVNSNVQSGNANSNVTFFDSPAGNDNIIESFVGEKNSYEIEAGTSKTIGSIEPADSIKVTIFVFSCNIDFVRLIEDGYLGIASINSQVGLFERFQNPTNRFTNIKGGVGIFAAYNPQILEIVLK